MFNRCEFLCRGEVALDGRHAEVDAAHAIAVAHTDYVAQINLLTLLAHQMRAASDGRIVVFSSIAGIRVRRANYVSPRGFTVTRSR